ncbi:hypothetical protein DOY81_005930 [Sarcophaga bullata]|nr:hypothetical protein DOY81_005930 [Sarcophaga bullata]
MTKESETVATIDEALDKTHFGKFNIQIIIFSGLVLNNVVLESVGVSFALPIVACDLNLSYQQQGILGAVCFMGIIVSSHLWGFLADTKGRKNIMRPTLLLAFLVTFISSFSYNFLMMTILRFLSGILISAGSATIFAYLGEFHCQKNRNKAILCGALISACSAVFFPIIAWIFINQEWELEIPFLSIIYKPWRLYFLVCGSSGLGLFLFLGHLPESPKYLLGVNRPEEALAVLRTMHSKNIRGNKSLKDDCFVITSLIPDADTPIQKKKMLTIQTHGVYMWFPYILNNAMLYTQTYDEPLCLCDILRVTQSSNFSIHNIINYEQENKECTTKLEISTYKHTIILEFIYISLLICVIFATKKFNRPPILCKFNFIHFLTNLLIIFVAFTIIVTILATCGLFGILSLLIDIPLVAIYLLVITLCCGLGTSVMNTIVVDIYPTNLRAMAVCISLMLGRIGSVTGSNVMGALIESHCEVALFSSSGALILAGILGFLMPKTHDIGKKTDTDNI